MFWFDPMPNLLIILFYVTVFQEHPKTGPILKAYTSLWKCIVTSVTWHQSVTKEIHAKSSCRSLCRLSTQGDHVNVGLSHWTCTLSGFVADGFIEFRDCYWIVSVEMPIWRKWCTFSTEQHSRRFEYFTERLVHCVLAQLVKSSLLPLVLERFWWTFLLIIWMRQLKNQKHITSNSKFHSIWWDC